MPAPDRKSKVIRTLLAIATAIPLGLAAHADSPAHPAVDSAQAGILAMFASARAAIHRHASTEEVAHIFYNDDLVVAIQGDRAYHGLRSFMRPLAGYLQGVERCHFKLMEPVQHSGDIAAAFVQEHCDPAKPGDAAEDLRILYVLKHGPKGWRVSQESAMEGVM